MRTTLTLEDEVMIGLRKLQKKDPSRSFKELVNDVIKKGLIASGEKSIKPFKVRPRYAVPRKGIDFDNIAEVISIAEGDFHK